MKTKLVIASILSISMISCGSGDNNNADSEKEASTEMNHEEMAAEGVMNDELTVPEGARVFFVGLQDGDEVGSPVRLEFGVDGMDVEPAGELNQGMGHHHIIVDGLSIPKGTVVPSDAQHIHFGQGEIEAEIELSPGEHTLILQFADGFHRSYGEQMGSKIVIVVK